MGASQSFADSRQSSSGIMSFRLVEYSRIRPQPVQVKLHVCKGSSCRTMANLGVRLILCLTICNAILAVSAKGNLITNQDRQSECQSPPETKQLPFQPCLLELILRREESRALNSDQPVCPVLRRLEGRRLKAMPLLPH